MQNIFLKHSILFIIGIFLCIPLFLFAQGWNGPTQPVLNQQTNTMMTVPASWDVTSGNWNATQSVLNPVTGAWITVPAGWVIPLSQTNDDPLDVTPGTPDQVPGASSDPLNVPPPGSSTGGTITTTTNTGITVSTAPDGRTVRDIVNLGIRFLNTLVPVLIALATVVFMASVVGILSNTGNEEKRSQIKQYMLWSLFALFVLISAWGLVAIFSSTFAFQFGLPQLGTQ